MSEITPEEIARLRQEHIGRLFLRAHRAFNELALKKLHAQGYHALSVAHTTLLPHLDVDGTQITVLAERVGITKQAVGQLIAELEQQDYVTREPDPRDKRAVRIIFTEKGWQFLQDAYHLKTEIEAEYTAILGAEAMEQLRLSLLKLLGDI